AWRERGAGQGEDEEEERERRRRRLGTEGARERHAGGERRQCGEQTEDLAQLQERDEEEGAGQGPRQAAERREGEEPPGRAPQVPEVARRQADRPGGDG